MHPATHGSALDSIPYFQRWLLYGKPSREAGKHYFIRFYKGVGYILSYGAMVFKLHSQTIVFQRFQRVPTSHSMYMLQSHIVQFIFPQGFYKGFEGFRETVCPFWKPCAGGSAGMLIFPHFPNVLKVPGKPFARTQTVCESSYIGRPRSVFMHSYNMASDKVTKDFKTKDRDVFYFGRTLCHECPGGKTLCFLQSAMRMARWEFKEN